jgi:chitinase
MKLYPLVVCLSLLTSACASEEEASDVDQPRQGPVRDNPEFEVPAGDGGAATRTDAASATVGSSTNSARDAALGGADGQTTVHGSNDEAGATEALPEAGAETDAGNARVDASTAVSDAAVTGADDAALTKPSEKSGVVVGYYPAWATYERDFQVAEVPGSKLTHINYAFANIENGRCVLGDAWADAQKTFAGDNWDESSADAAGNFKQLRKLKQANPNLRTLISVGGWTWSTNFSDAAVSDAARKTFASSCVDFMVTHGFDGIDIDWEYPMGGGLEGNKSRPEDKANYTLLLKALRAELSARQKSAARAEAFLLTIAAPAGPSIIEHLDPAGIAQVVDWINIMSYDFHGSWEKTTGHNAPLAQATGDSLAGFNVESAIDAYLKAGAPASRLVMGVPFYGRSFAGVTAGSTRGLHQSTSGAGPGTWENGVLDYHDIAARYLTASNYVRYTDDSASVPYLIDPSKGIFISYDDATSIRKKRALIAKKKLAGSMIWDLSSDTADHVLLNALTQ